jgi:uncharacterized membrane protein YeaQ/YmgE (transglycosylase-associated protein family)
MDRASKARVGASRRAIAVGRAACALWLAVQGVAALASTAVRVEESAELSRTIRALPDATVVRPALEAAQPDAVATEGAEEPTAEAATSSPPVRTLRRPPTTVIAPTTVRPVTERLPDGTAAVGPATDETSATAAATPAVAAPRASSSLSATARRSIATELRLTERIEAGETVQVQTPGAAPVAVTRENLAEVIKPGAVFASRVGTAVAERRVGDVEGFELPVRYEMVTREGHTRSFAPFVRVLRPLTFKSADAARDGQFTGSVAIGVVDADRPGARDALPYAFQFTFAGNAELAPDEVAISKLNQPFKRVNVSTRAASEQVVIEVISAMDGKTDTITLPVVRPTLEVRVNPDDEIDGFGLGSAQVTVAASEGPAFAGHRVTLAARGWLEESNLTLDEAGVAETTLRSRLVGDAALEASGYPFAAATATLRYGWPIAFTVAALAGALGGTLVRGARHEPWLASLLFGLVGAILAALGVNFLNLPVTLPFGEAFALVVSFMTAYWGPRALGRFAPAGAKDAAPAGD